MEQRKLALLSVYNKQGIVQFAQGLRELGWTILASGGTCKALKDKGIPVTDVSAWVGGGPILGHRVVTLSREIAAALLATDSTEDQEELHNNGIERIDLVCVDMYPLENAIADPEATTESVIEMTDVGGPTMLSEAAKGRRIVICDPDDRSLVLQQLQQGGVLPETRNLLCAKAELAVAIYRLASARFHSGGDFDGLIGTHALGLGKAENADQNPACLLSLGTNDPLALDWLTPINGLERLSHVNMCGIDQGTEVLCLIAASCLKFFPNTNPYIAVACKHGNPCGVGLSFDSSEAAVQKAMMGDPAAVMGAEVVTNFHVTAQVTDQMLHVPNDMIRSVGRKNWGPDVIVGPSFDDNAMDMLTKRSDRRVLVNYPLKNPTMPEYEWVYRPVRGGLLRQRVPVFVLGPATIMGWVGDRLDTSIPNNVDVIRSLIIAFAVAWRSSSNSVAIAKHSMLIGSGIGQKDRRRATKLAVEIAESSGHNVDGSVAASDAFFPFAERRRMNQMREGPELLADKGCNSVVVPFDGVNKERVAEYFNTRHVRVAYVAPEHRGFFRH